MTLARKLLDLFDEAGAHVPRSVRRIVEAQEGGTASREGDPAKLLEALAMTRVDLHARVRSVIAGARAA